MPQAIHIWDGQAAIYRDLKVTDMTQPKTFLNIAGAATTLVKTGPGVLDAIVFNKAVASSVVTVYDSLSATGTKIATITQPLTLLDSQRALAYGAVFVTGLTVVTSAADDITVIYR